jgi:hypothetical protein
MVDDPLGELRRGDYVYARPALCLELSPQTKRAISELFERYPYIIRGYLVGLRGPVSSAPGLQIGIEVIGLASIEAAGLRLVPQSPEVWSLLHAIDDQTRQWIPAQQHCGVVVVNNLDFYLGVGGAARFVDLAECIYEKKEGEQEL